MTSPAGEANAPKTSAARSAKAKPFPLVGYAGIVALFATAIALAVGAIYRDFPDDATAIGFLGLLLVLFLIVGCAADALADRLFGADE